LALWADCWYDSKVFSWRKGYETALPAALILELRSTPLEYVMDKTKRVRNRKLEYFLSWGQDGLCRKEEEGKREDTLLSPVKSSIIGRCSFS
jgi:hypothetical protein